MAAYTIIDLKGTSLSGTPATIAGVHTKIGNADCPIRLSGINYGGTKYKDVMIGVLVFSLWTAVAIVGLYGIKEDE